MVERDRFEGEGLLGPRRQVGPRHLVRAIGRRRWVEVRDQDGALKGRQLGAERVDDLAAIERLSPVRVAIDRDEHLRLDLDEPIDQARVPKSGEQLAQIAPMLAHASSAMTASGMFGTTATTLSPRPTPRRRNPAATAATDSRNSRR